VVIAGRSEIWGCWEGMFDVGLSGRCLGWKVDLSSRLFPMGRDSAFVFRSGHRGHDICVASIYPASSLIVHSEGAAD